MMMVEGTRWVRVDDPRLENLAEGRLIRVIVKSKPICFVRMNGTLHALSDVCPHQGKSIAGGWCEEDHIVCPWHRMRFDPVTGRNAQGATTHAEVFALESRRDGVYLGFPYTTFKVFGIELW